MCSNKDSVQLKIKKNLASNHAPHYLLLQFSSVTQSRPTLCDPMSCSMPGLPVHHQLPELTQTHVHSVGDAMQPYYPLSSPSPAFNLSNPHLQVFAKWIFFSETIQCHWQPTSLSTPYPPSSVYF